MAYIIHLRLFYICKKKIFRFKALALVTLALDRPWQKYIKYEVNLIASKSITYIYIHQNIERLSRAYVDLNSQDLIN
jgi:hypothetical protein